jgi:hypothetical protein
MNNAEGVGFLRKYLDDFERYAKLEGTRRLRKPPSDAERAEHSELADSLQHRKLVAVALLRAAGIFHIPLMDPKFADYETMRELRASILQAIGAYEHKMVCLDGAPAREPTPTAPAQPPAPPTSGPEPRTIVTADDIPEMPLGQLFRTLKVRHGLAAVTIVVALLGAGGTAGFAAGSWWGGFVEKRNQEHAVERITEERDACQQEVAALKAAFVAAAAGCCERGRVGEVGAPRAVWLGAAEAEAQSRPGQGRDGGRREQIDKGWDGRAQQRA